MSGLVYVRLSAEADADIPRLRQIHQMPEVSRFISIGDNYFRYVTTTENLWFYKVYENGKLIGSIHLEKQDDVLYMDVLIFPEFQRMGFGTRVIKDIQDDVFGLGYGKIGVAVDEKNTASIKLFENAGFVFVSQEDELMNFVYGK